MNIIKILKYLITWAIYHLITHKTFFSLHFYTIKIANTCIIIIHIYNSRGVTHFSVAAHYVFLSKYAWHSLLGCCF